MNYFLPNYQIVEQQYGDGTIKYILEQQQNVDGVLVWESVYRHTDLEEVRRVKAERLNRFNATRKVIE